MIKQNGYPYPVQHTDQDRNQDNSQKDTQSVSNNKQAGKQRPKRRKKQALVVDGYRFTNEAQLMEYLSRKEKAASMTDESKQHLEEYIQLLQQKESKYHSRRMEIDGIVFSSRKEGRRYQELKLMEQQGEITDLSLQKKYVIFPKQKDERKIEYRADFYYRLPNGTEVVEDTKGMRTAVYIIKRKLFKFFYPEVKFVEL